MNPNQLKRLEQLKQLNKEFCSNALECSKNLSFRDPIKKFQLSDLEPIDYLRDRLDRSLFNSDDSYLFYLDVDYHKTTSLKEMIMISNRIAKIVDNKFPKFFSSKFSGRGVHMCTLIKNDKTIVSFLKENKIDKIYDFVKGICYGISLSIKDEITKLEEELKIKGLDCFDYQQLHRDGSIRGFCINDKAELSGHKMFSVPISLTEDNLNSIINKSMLLKDFDDKFIIPEFNDELYKIYKPLPKSGKKSENRLLRLNPKDADIPIDFDFTVLAPCLQNLIKKKDLGNRERFILIGTLLSIPLTPVSILQIFKQYLSRTTFEKMWKERQIESIFNTNQRVKHCHVIKEAKLCPGCNLTNPHLLMESQSLNTSY